MSEGLRRSPRRTPSQADASSLAQPAQLVVEDDDSGEEEKRTPNRKKFKRRFSSIKASEKKKKHSNDDEKMKKKKNSSDDEYELSSSEDDDEKIPSIPALPKKTKTSSSVEKLGTNSKSASAKKWKPKKAKSTVIKGPRAIDAVMSKKKQKKDGKTGISIAAMKKRQAQKREAEYSSVIREMAQQSQIKGLSGSTTKTDEYKVQELTDEALETAGKELAESHRKNFETLNFPHGIDKDQERSKHHSAGRVAEYIHILTHWEEDRDSLTLDEKKLDIIFPSCIV